MPQYRLEYADVQELAAVSRAKSSELLFQVLRRPLASVRRIVEDDLSSCRGQRTGSPIDAGNPAFAPSLNGDKRIQRLSASEIEAPVFHGGAANIQCIPPRQPRIEAVVPHA